MCSPVVAGSAPSLGLKLGSHGQITTFFNYWVGFFFVFFLFLSFCFFN